MCYDEYDDDYIDYDDLDDGEQYSYERYEKKEKEREEQRQIDLCASLRETTLLEIYLDILLKNNIDVTEIYDKEIDQFIVDDPEQEMCDLLYDNNLYLEVFGHKDYKIIKECDEFLGW